MATEAELVSIYNYAMSLAGGRSTIAATAETSAEAKIMNIQYERTLKQMLDTALWSFARRAARGVVFKAAFGVTDAPVGTAATWDSTWPPPPWMYEYKQPADCLRVRYVVPFPGATSGATVSPTVSADNYYVGNPPYEFIVSSDTDTAPTPDTFHRVILTNLNAPVIIYTAYLNEPTLWPPLFEQAFAFMLAARIAQPLGASMEFLKINLQQGLTLLQQAQVANANQGMQFNLSTPEWLRVRGINPPEPGLIT